MFDRIIHVASGIIIAGLFVHDVYMCNSYNALNDSLEEAQRTALNKTIDLQRQLSDLEYKYTEETKKADETINNLRTSIATASRVRIKTVYRDSSSSSTNEHATNDCELDRETANSLVDIAEIGDRAIRERNKCILMYNNLLSK